jgi:hypothetical protein
MGCKYKHEMPMDKETQMSLGLNHGLPNWYRRAYAVNVHSPTPPALNGPPPQPARNRLEGPWRQLELAQATEDYAPPGSSMQSPTCKLTHNHTFESLANDSRQRTNAKATVRSLLQLLKLPSPIIPMLLSRSRSRMMTKRKRS